MPEYTAITYELAESVARITLNRPAAANTLNEALSSEMLDAIIRSEENTAVRALVVSGGTVPSGSGGGSTQAPSNSGSLANCPVPVSAQALSALIFGGMTWLGYRASYKYGQPPRTQGHHLAGMIPGAINGASIAYYVSNAILPNQLVVETPNSSLTANLLPLVFGLGLLGLLVVLLVANQSNKSAKP